MIVEVALCVSCEARALLRLCFSSGTAWSFVALPCVSTIVQLLFRIGAGFAPSSRPMPALHDQLTLVRATAEQRLEIYRGSAVCFAGGATVDEYIAQQQCAISVRL